MEFIENHVEHRELGTKPSQKKRIEKRITKRMRKMMTVFPSPNQAGALGM